MYSFLKKIGILVFLLLGIIVLKAQSHLESVRQFSITTETDTINFIKTSYDITTPKPTILFCQGSLPVPVIITFGDNYFIPSVNNFNYKELSEKYNIVVISMPHTPLVADVDSLTKAFHYVPDISKPNERDQRYMKDNYLEKYVERGNVVLEFLRKQPWVKKDEIILIGHSQGSYIVADLASQNSDIFAIGYFGGNPLGRFNQFILEQRNRAKSGKIISAEAQANIEKLYKNWRKICEAQDEDPSFGDTPRTTKSFTTFDIDKLSNLKIPVFIAYGTEDDGAQFCDFLPVYFELAGKKNYICRAFVGYGHNFEEKFPDGKSNFEKIHWQDVINEFIAWCEKL